METTPADAAPDELVQLHHERGRVVRDLHDHVVQRLFAIGLSLQRIVPDVANGPAAATIDRAIGEIDEAIADVRAVIYGLRADVRRHGDLRRRLLAIADGGGLGPPTITVRTVGPVDTLIGPQQAADVEAVVREGVSNAVRHAHATQVTATVTAADTVRVTITDDGCGFDPDVPRSGLDNLAQRAAHYGGTFQVTGTAATGTELVWQVPLR